MRRKILSITILFLPLMLIGQIRADYVLPYPSLMPGNKLYKISRLVDTLKKYWYWGNISQIRYHMGLSDKYLVEAKILFEYKQYILAVDALRRSNNEFFQVKSPLHDARNNQINTSHIETQIQESALVQREVIQKLKQQLPAEYTWKEEKKEPVVLPLFQLLEEAHQLRSQPGKPS